MYSIHFKLAVFGEMSTWNSYGISGKPSDGQKSKQIIRLGHLRFIWHLPDREVCSAWNMNLLFPSPLIISVLATCLQRITMIQESHRVSSSHSHSRKAWPEGADPRRHGRRSKCRQMLTNLHTFLTHPHFCDEARIATHWDEGRITTSTRSILRVRLPLSL